MYSPSVATIFVEIRQAAAGFLVCMHVALSPWTQQ